MKRQKIITKVGHLLTLNAPTMAFVDEDSKKSWSQIYNINVCSCQCALVSNIEYLRWLPLDGCFSFSSPLFRSLPQTLINISDIITHISMRSPSLRLFPRAILIKTLSFAQISAYCIVRKRINDARMYLSLCTLIKFRKQGFGALE